MSAISNDVARDLIKRQAGQVVACTGLTMAEIIHLQQAIEAVLEVHLPDPTTEPEPEPEVCGVPLSFLTSSCPSGYETIIGFLARCRPELLSLMWDDDQQLAEDTKRDEFKCTHLTHRAGLRPVKVPAPEIFRLLGINQINAYPESVLERRFS